MIPGPARDGYADLIAGRPAIALVPEAEWPAARTRRIFGAG